MTLAGAFNEISPGGWCDYFFVKSYLIKRITQL